MLKIDFDLKKAKEKSKKNVKKHYIFFVLICLLATFIGAAYIGSSAFYKTTTIEVAYDQTIGHKTGFSIDDVFSKIVQGDFFEGTKISEMIKNQKIDTIFGSIDLKNAKGVISSIISSISSGQFLLVISETLLSIFESKSIAITIFIILSALVILAFNIFAKSLYRVIFRRTFLEAHLYEEVKLNSLTFLFRTKKIVKASFTSFICSVFQFLWDLTIIGGIIKSYSYALVPYIVAENPSIKTMDAIKLSEDMMKGHKLELFKIDIHFLGWWLLGTATLGISEILFSNPYKESVMVEYYVYLRDSAKKNKIKNVDLLNDIYLYEYAPNELIDDYYKDIIEIMNDDIILEDYKHTGFRGFIEDNLGMIYKYDKEEDGYNEAIEQEEKIDDFKNVLVKKQYPERIIHKTNTSSRLESVHYLRHYSFWSIVVLFFIFCFVGWIWEVMLCLVQNGYFCNRGTMHGPWLPIYGSGCIMILCFLYRFRKNIGLEALMTVLLCGFVEYMSSWALEMMHGVRWWDYSDVFLNLNGRICAEGLLVFMLGGLAVTYVAAPQIDNLIRKIKQKILVPICCILLFIFALDFVYSQFVPNTGKGITDYEPNTTEVSNK